MPRVLGFVIMIVVIHGSVQQATVLVDPGPHWKKNSGLRTMHPQKQNSESDGQLFSFLTAH
jgi:hypothetical protein